MLRRGVYVTDVTVDGETVRGITNVGAHPTFGDHRENIETYLIDTDIDCYGKEIKVSFLHYVRPITGFGSADELKARITRDIAIAKEY